MGLVVVGVLAAAARAVGKARFIAVILAVGAAVPAPILARIAVDTAKDPTSHNLWPFEFIIAAVIGVLSSSPWLEACPYFFLAIKTQPNPRWSRP